MALTNLSQITTSGIATLTDINLNNITGVAATFTGNVTVGGTLTYDDVTNIDSVGLITARSGIIVATGTATTALVVEGNARITGILTVGSSSLTLDGTNNVVNVGTALTLGHTQGLQFHTQNLHSQGFEVNNVNATGIVTATTFIGNLTGTASNASGATGDFSIADKIVHTGDTNTAIRFPADDTVTVETAGSERLRVTSDGKIGIGTISVPNNFNVEIANNGTTGLNIRNTNDSANDSCRIAFSQGSGNLASSNTFADIFPTVDTVSPLSGHIKFRTNEGNNLVERLRITSDGSVGIGTDNPQSLLSLHQSGGGFEVNANSGSNNARLLSYDRSASSYREMTFQALSYGFATGGNTERLRITSAGNITASNTQFTTHVHQEYTGFNDGNSVVNYLLVCPTTNTNIRFVGTIMAGRHGGASGVGGGMIDVALIGSSNGVADKVDYNIRSMSTHGTYNGPQGQWCTIDFGGTTYYAIRFSSSGSDMWGATPQHCSFNGYINNCTPVGKNTTDDTLANETILTTERGRNTFQNTKIGLDTVNPYYKLDVRFNNADTALSGGTSGFWAGNGLRLQNNNTTAGSMSLLHFRSGDSADWHIGTKYVSANNSDIVFLQEGVNEKLRIKNNGKIGIGKTDPDTLLHVHGTASSQKLITLTCSTLRNNYIGVNASDNLEIGADEDNEGSDSSIRFRVDGSEKLRIHDGGNVGINSTGGSGKLEIGQSNGNIAFRIRNTSSNVGTNKFQIYCRSSGDGDYHTMAYYHPNNYPLFASNYSGTWMSYASVYAGRTRSNSASPTNHYRHGAHSFSAYSARTDSTTAYRSHIFTRAWDGGDDADRNAIYYVNSGSDTVTVDYDQHQKFGVKGNGMAQFGGSIFASRVESDEATPNSVYLGSSGTTVIVYPNSSSQWSRMDARTTDNTDRIFGADTGGGVVFKVESSGKVESDGGYDTPATDYAEYFEWTDGNPNNEDRRGITVVMVGEKIRPSTNNDDRSKIIGVVSAQPSVVGDSAWSEWHLAHQKDVYGSFVTEDFEYLVWNRFGTFTDVDGVKKPNPQPNINDYNRDADYQVLISEIEVEKAKGNVPQAAIDQNLRVTKPSRTYNPDYDPNRDYVPRSRRKEWDPIGLLGKLVVRRGQPIGSNWILMKSDRGVDPNDNSIILDRYFVR